MNEGYRFYEEDIMSGRVDDDKGQPDSSTESSSFEEIAARMVDVTADGGVKKQTMVHGTGEVIPSDANVTSNLFLIISLVSACGCGYCHRSIMFVCQPLLHASMHLLFT